MTSENKNIRSILAAAVAMVLAGAGVASAQYQVDRSGANDANNRVGSGGVNPVDNRIRPWELQNNIVYGNVTGGKEFRGPVGSFDSRAFRGGTADINSDIFVRNSAGVSTNGVTSYNTQATRTFYGESRAVAPPPGFVQIPGSGGYVPPKPSAWRQVDPRTGAITQDADVVFRPDQFGMPGPVDRTFAPGAVQVPSNISTRDIDGSLSDYTQLNRGLNNELTAQQAQQLYNELNGASNNPAAGPRQANQPPGNTDKTPGKEGPEVDPNAMPAGTLRQQTIGTPLDNAMNASTLDQTLQSGGSEPGIQTRLMMSADQQSTYAQLQARRQQQEGPMRPGQANERAAQEFNQQLRDKEEADKAAGNDKPAPGGAGGARPAGGGGAPTNNVKPDGDKPAPGAEKPAPVRVPTLGGEKQSALNDLMKKAEASMREGKYANAIETYESAERVAPANPLVQLGRAHAELGGGYYVRAEQDLRKTLIGDQNLMQGQYDLTGTLGKDRLETIERDLRDRIQKNEKDVGAPLLLAYVYYNTSNEQRAAALLDLADKRAGGNDSLVKLLKKNWSLPGADQNK